MKTKGELDIVQPHARRRSRTPPGRSTTPVLASTTTPSVPSGRGSTPAASPATRCPEWSRTSAGGTARIFSGVRPSTPPALTVWSSRRGSEGCESNTFQRQAVDIVFAFRLGFLMFFYRNPLSYEGNRKREAIILSSWGIAPVNDFRSTGVFACFKCSYSSKYSCRRSGGSNSFQWSARQRSSPLLRQIWRRW